MQKKLKDLRKDANLSIVEVCLKLNISEATLEDIESGKDLSVNYKNYLKLLKESGINLKKLFV